MPGSPVDHADLERGISRLQAVIGDDPHRALAGPFGPDSTLWHVTREAAVFLCAGRALLLQLAHPWVARAIAAHSSALDDPFGRFHRTFGTVYVLVFGSAEQAFATARRLHRRHAAITGTFQRDLGAFRAGTRFLANDVDALRWVHATLVDGALRAFELAAGAIGGEARERWYADALRLGELFGIPTESQPSDWRGFAGYVEAMIDSPILEVGDDARRVGLHLLAGGGRIRVPAWYRDLTAGLLPPRFRAGYGLEFDERARRRSERALRAVLTAYPRLPAMVRHVGPYHEALGRIAGRPHPTWIVRTSNRLWIGRPRLDASR
jgi:uncharacterized protein (DUF2236 family)